MVMVARLQVVTEPARSRAGFYDRLTLGQHPAALLIPRDRVQGAAGELYVSLLTITAIPKGDILERRGALTDEEMRQVSERLVKTLELDISRLIRPVTVPGRDGARAQLPWWSRRGESDPRPGAVGAWQVAADEPQPSREPRPGTSGGPQARRRRR
jgi:hypothetical protein